MGALHRREELLVTEVELNIDGVPSLAEALEAPVGNFFSNKDACHRANSLPCLGPARKTLYGK